MSMIPPSMDSGHLRILLESDKRPGVAETLRMLVARDPSERLAVGRQPASRTGKTFGHKYGMAASAGHVVVGLPSTLVRLEELGDRIIGGCVVQGEDEFSVIVLDDALSTVEGLFYVRLVSSE